MKAVLIHGAWHGAWCWKEVVASLERDGVEAAAVELPFTGFADDVASARRAIEAAGEGSVVLLHSYGGAVGSQAATGLPVARLVYLAAFMLAPGEEPTRYMDGGELPSALVVDASGVRVDPGAAARIFFGDADPQTAAAAVAQLRPMALQGGPPSVTEPAWWAVPSTYVVCTNDRALPVASQRAMAARATDVVEWPTDHSPFLTRPDEVARLVSGCGA